MFVFGDGSLDVGNNNYIEPNEVGDPWRANHSYYGIDFPKSEPTGRFSNGFNMADFIGMLLLVPSCQLFFKIIHFFINLQKYMLIFLNNT